MRQNTEQKKDSHSPALLYDQFTLTKYENQKHKLIYLDFLLLLIPL